MLLNDTGFLLEEGEKIALIARNGAGKSTLLSVIRGEEGVESGTVRIKKGLRISTLEQAVEFPVDCTILDAVLHSNEPLRKVWEQYYSITEAGKDGNLDTKALDAVTREMDSLNGLEFRTKSQNRSIQTRSSRYDEANCSAIRRRTKTPRARACHSGRSRSVVARRANQPPRPSNDGMARRILA